MGKLRQNGWYCLLENPSIKQICKWRLTHKFRNLDIPSQPWNSAPPTCLSSPVSLSGNFGALNATPNSSKEKTTTTTPCKSQPETPCTNSTVNSTNNTNIPIDKPDISPEMKEVRTSSSWTPGSSNYPEWSTPKAKEETSKNNRVMTLIGICNTDRNSPLPEQGSLQRPESQASIGSSISDKEEIKNYSKYKGKVLHVKVHFFRSLRCIFIQT